MRTRRTLGLTAAALGFLAAVSNVGSPAVEGQGPRTSRVEAVTNSELRVWDAQVDRMLRSGALQLRLDREDTLLPGRRHLRFTQVVDDVPVYGGDLVRRVDAAGATVSIFGTVHEGVSIGTEPTLAADEIQTLASAMTGVELGPGRPPRLVVLPEGQGGYRLVYLVRVATAEDVTLYFMDAHTGEVVARRSDAHTQTAVAGLGTGVLGDRKKMSTASQGGGFVGSDRRRPPVIETYDMRGNLSRTLSFLNGVIDIGPSDLAADSDNDWTDGANVDAHTYAGYTYDYFYKRFGRRGLDNANIRIRSLTHPVNRSDLTRSSNTVIGLFFINAFYAGDGIMVYGEGLPPGFFTQPGRQSWDYIAGALDIVGHELAHGVTDYSSGLIYEGESGALNEAFSDIMATAIEFFFQEPGAGQRQADYLIGEDVIRPGGIRSLENPGLYGDPDHYSQRFTGPEDNGGVHINSGIVNQAYYLAVEGGVNRTSGRAVQGVGRANREQMERVFYRAFTQMLPANATFATARVATIQAARDLFGANSAAERALVDAWTAVGVE
jgi:bacillolysin